MNRKTLISLLVLLAVLIAGTGVAVAFLYSDTGKDSDRAVTQVADDDRYLLFHAIPSDAVLVASVSELSDAVPGMFDSLGLPDDCASCSTVCRMAIYYRL